MKRIGILGGMGPEATVELISRLIATTPAQDDADHIPLMVDMNPQVPSRISRIIEGRGADPGPVLAGMAQRLQSAGAEALAMPCNTAHFYAQGIVVAALVVTTAEFLSEHYGAPVRNGQRSAINAGDRLRRGH